MKNISEFSIAKRSQLLFLGVAAVLTIISANIAWLFPTRGELEEQAYLLHRAIADNARNQLFLFLSSYERSLSDGADVLNQSSGKKEDIISRLLKENQPFESLTLLNNSGLETFKKHRFLLISESDLKSRSQENLFKIINEGSIYRGPVEISGFSEPIITIAVPVSADNFSALVAEINLKFFLDVVRNVAVNKESLVYAVDEGGYIVAHPDSSLVFGRTNLINRKIIIEALAGREADTRTEGFDYQNEGGENMFGVALPFELMGWAVAVEEPRSVAFEASARISTVAAISFALEILLGIVLIWNYVNLIKTASLFFQEKNQREAILNSLYDGVLEYDENFKIKLLNPKAEEILGVKFSDIADTPITPDIAEKNSKLRALAELMYPSLAPYASSAKQLQGSSAKAMEIHTSKPELKLLVTLTQVLDDRGNVRGFLKIIHDASREQLISKLKSEFVSIAAHQLRTPLSAIKWTLKFMLDGDAGALSASQMEYLEKGYAINERMIHLVNDLLNAARIEEGRFGYEFKELDLVSFVKETVTNYDSAAKSKSIDLRFEEIKDDFPMIFADKEKLSLALTNVIDNAIKYTLKGGKVNVTLLKKGDFAEVTVFDNGLGIPEEEKKKVFSKFFRASNVLRMETEGTGLGLFITYNIIKRHGGDVTFDSKDGATSFIFTIPLRKENVPTEESPTLKEFLETI